MSAVFSVDDLAGWSRAGTSLAVLGHPIRHSLSPPMHNAALAELAATDGKFRDWEYFRFDIPPPDLFRALALLHAKKFRGVNLTVPHKVLAFSRVAQVDQPARAIGAVNTLRWSETGWEGFNTDGYGLATAIREALGLELSGAPVLLLGAGGAARGAAIECLRRRCRALWIANRTAATLSTLIGALQSEAGGVPIRELSPSALPADLPAGLIIINATSAGLDPKDSAPIELTALPRPAAVFEMIYNPPTTPLLRMAKSLGIPCANGLTMLVHQGAKSLEIWSDVPAGNTAPAMMRAVSSPVC